MDMVTVEAELRTPAASALLARYVHDGPSDFVTRRDDAYWLDLGLTPRVANARARYVDDWSPNRYERLGAVFCVPAGHAVQFCTDGGEMASISCELSPQRLSAWFDEELSWSEERLAANLSITNGHIRELMLRLGRELRQPGLAGAALIELIVGQITLELARHQATLADPPAPGGLCAWRLEAIETRLAEGREAPSLSELADVCQISVRQLARGFRASRGVSLGRYIEQSRLAHAKRRLQGDESVKAIALSLGFSTAANFAYAFRRATGLTPGQFRDESRAA